MNEDEILTAQPQGLSPALRAQGMCSQKHDYPTIWLEPNCEPPGVDNRSWCQDNVWDRGCEECGYPPTQYVRSDIAALNERAALLKCEQALREIIRSGTADEYSKAVVAGSSALDEIDSLRGEAAAEAPTSAEGVSP